MNKRQIRMRRRTDSPPDPEQLEGQGVFRWALVVLITLFGLAGLLASWKAL